MAAGAGVDPFAELLPPPLPERFSVSFIGATTECLLRARLDREAGIGGYFATIGSAAHEVFATCSFKAQLLGLMKLSADEAEQIAQRVLANPERAYAMTYPMHQYVVKMARTWAESVDFPTDADTWVIEHPFRIPILDEERGVTYTLSGRMDEYAIWNRDRHYRNRDWKTGPRLPTRKEVEEEHTQLPLYALAAFREHPYIETFECVEYYSRHGVPRPITLTRDDMPEIEAWLIAQCRTIVKAYHENDFPATPSERWCNLCPMPDRCPKPESVRQASVIRTEAEARAQLEAALVLDARKKQAMGAFRGWLEGTGIPTLTVGGKEYGFITRNERRLNEQRLNSALALLGMTKEEFYEVEPSTEFGSRKRT